jgi:O-antigen ligase
MYTTKNNSEHILVIIASCLAILFGILAASGQTPFILLLFSPIIPLIFIFRDFRVGALLLITLLPFQHTPFLPSFTGFNIINYLTAASLLSLWGNRFFKKLPLSPMPSIFIWAYVLPILVAGIHGTLNLDRVPHIPSYNEIISLRTYLTGYVLKPLAIVLISWLLGCVYIQTEKKERLILPLIIGCVVPALFLIGFIISHKFDLKILSSPRNRELLSSMGMHANELGTLLGLAFSILLFLIPATLKGRAKVTLLICFAIVSAALLLTFSRGGYSAALIAMIGFIIIHRQIKYGLVIIGILSIIIAFNPDVFIGRVTTGLSETNLSAAADNDHDSLTAGRVWVWKSLLPDFLSSPVWGNGVASTSWSTPARLGIIQMTHPHNLYLHILLDLGCLGLLFFGLFVRYLLKTLNAISKDSTTPRLFKGLADGTRFGLLGFLVSGLATGYYVPTSESSILWMAIGLLLPLIQQHSQKRHSFTTYTPAPKLEINATLPELIQFQKTEHQSGDDLYAADRNAKHSN